MSCSRPKAEDVLDSGSGPAILCLHGFPENRGAFDTLAEQLVADGFRVIRYNQRGYTDDTDGCRRCEYTVRRLASDAIRVMDELMIDSWTVVGHDLGGLVAWEMGRVAPNRTKALVIVSVPHPAAFVLSLIDPRQVFRAWYFVLAQSTLAATLLYSPSRPKSRRRFANGLARRGLPPHESSRYLDYLALGKRFAGAIKWYQAMPFSRLSSTFFRGKVRTHILWGRDDALTGRLSIALSRYFVKRNLLKITEIANGTHWLVDQRPTEVARAVTAANREFDLQASRG
jgi:pimeloyl-ACP methyl ester carboxylesterase